MPLSGLMNVLQRYTGASAENPPETAAQDFQHVAQNASPDQLATGLAEAFRSDQTPPFPSMVADLFRKSNGDQRAGILNQLLTSVGPSVLGSGILSGAVGALQSGGAVTAEQANAVAPEAVQQLADHAEKQNPSIVDQASSFYAQHPTLVQALGAGSLALIMSRMSRS